MEPEFLSYETTDILLHEHMQQLLSQNSDRIIQDQDFEGLSGIQGSFDEIRHGFEFHTTCGAFWISAVWIPDPSRNIVRIRGSLKPVSCSGLISRRAVDLQAFMAVVEWGIMPTLLFISLRSVV